MTRSRSIRSTLWGSILITLALGAALRLWFINHAATISGDTFLYGDIALSWINHGIYGFSRPPLEPVPTLIRLPGYPLFLALCFRLFGPEHYTAVLLVQLVVDLLGCLLLADLARRLFGTRSGWIALVLAALCPFTASYAAAALTETLTLAAIAAAFYALDRWRTEASQPTRRSAQTSHPPATWTPWNRWLGLLSIPLAAAILLRPEQGLLAAAILPAVLWIAYRAAAPIADQVASSAANAAPNLASHTFRPAEASPFGLWIRAAAPALAGALLVLLPLVPWTIRNARTFQVFEPLAPRSATDPGDPTASGFDRWYRTWGVDFASTEDIYWNYDGAPVPLSEVPARAFDSPAQFDQTADLLSDYNLTNKPSPEIEARFRQIAADRTHAHPFRVMVILPVARLANMLLRPRVEMLPISLAWWRFHEHPGETLFALAYGALNLVYLATGTVGLIRWVRRPHNPTRIIAWSMIAFTLLRCSLLLTLDNSEPRYTLELFPILITGIAAIFASPTADRTSSSYPS